MHDVLVTGGAGFIGSHFVRRLLAAADINRVTVLDALTYAGSRENLGDAFLSPKLAFAEGSTLDADLVAGLTDGHTAVVHFAAESHVDRSFFEAGNFLATNVLGTCVLLEAARQAGVARFVHVSTDEVYGPLPDGSVSESAPLAPSVPYAASKACADLVALSYWQTYGVPVCVTRSSNNYGPGQHPGEDDPSLGHQPAQGREDHPARPGRARPQLAARRGQLRRHRTGPARRNSRRGLQHRREHRVGQPRPGRAAPGCLRIVAEASVTQQNAHDIYTLPGSPIKSLDQLTGKRLAVNAQLNVDYLLDASLLTENGLSPSRVHFVVVPFSRMVSELRDHQVDAVTLPEPFATIAEETAGATALADTNQGATQQFPIAGYVVTRAWAQKYPGTLASFLRALKQGQQTADTDRGAVEQAMEAYRASDGVQPIIAAVMTLDTYPTGIDPVRLQRVPNIMFQFGLLPHSFGIQQMLG